MTFTFTSDLTDLGKLAAGDWIYVEGLAWDATNAIQEAACNGWFIIDSVIVNTSFVTVSYIANTLADTDTPTSLTTVSFPTRRLYKDDEQTYEWTGDFKASVRYKRELYDTPEEYQLFLVATSALRLAASYPQSKFELERAARQQDDSKRILQRHEDRQSDYTIFDNYDTAIILGRHRNYVI